MAAGLGYIEFATGDVLTAAQANGYLSSQVVMVFASAAARTSAIASPQEGMISYLKDTNSTEYYSGSAWVAIGGGGLSSPLTTKGDVWGYSTTNARVPVGTNGQILTADSTEALGVKWATAATAASGLTFISKTSWSAAASVTVDGVFTSTYQNYLIIINDWVGSAYNVIPQMQLRYGSSTSGSVIYGSSYGCPYTGSPLIFQTTTAAAAFDFWRYIGDGSGSFIHCNIERVGTGSAQKSLITGHGLTDAGSEQFKFGGIWTDSQAYTGFVLKTSSGTSTGNVSIYGYAKA